MLEILRYSSVLFDNRFELNNDLKAIVDMTRPNKHQSRTAGQKIAKQLHAMWSEVLGCYANKLLAKDHYFSPDNVWKYLASYGIYRLSKSLVFKMLVNKCNFLLQLLLKIYAYLSRCHCNKNFP